MVILSTRARIVNIKHCISTRSSTSLSLSLSDGSLATRLKSTKITPKYLSDFFAAWDIRMTVRSVKSLSSECLIMDALLPAFACLSTQGWFVTMSKKTLLMTWIWSRNLPSLPSGFYSLKPSPLSYFWFFIAWGFDAPNPHRSKAETNAVERSTKPPSTLFVYKGIKRRPQFSRAIIAYIKVVFFD